MTRKQKNHRRWREKNKNTPHYKYTNHRQHARKRGISFLLTFEEWWQIWEISGHWAERGQRHGQYCMSRPGDRGAYEVGNVVIRLVEENNAERNQNQGVTMNEKRKLWMVGRRIVTLPDGRRTWRHP